MAYYLKEKGFADRIEPHNLVFLSEANYIIYSKKTVSSDLVKAFDIELKKIQNNGTFQSILDRYTRQKWKDLKKWN